MCGFVGYLGGIGGGFRYDQLKHMTDTIAHRGPDSAGYWRNLDQGIWLGHRRLAIVDLSPAGSQPMVSVSERYVIVFNGEIYNHQALRAEMVAAGCVSSWRGHSDTETLLAGFDNWGIRSTVERAVGMFAFAVWDRDSATLTLARDRMGEKPVYYGWQGSGAARTFLFGSELKALRAHAAFENRIDRGALCLQLRHNCVPAPHCIYQSIAKLLPGSLLTVSLRNPVPDVSHYWQVAQAAQAGVAQPFAASAEEAVDALETLLKDAVRQQMVADVPLGAFLSGGVDSSLIVALMQLQSSRPVKTFTIGFQEDAYNEAGHALRVARAIGTDHTELYVSGADAIGVIDSLPALYDEPFSDSSQIPTFLVARLAKQHVTVALSGDGGDELFCGYDRYQSAAGTWDKLSKLPRPLRRALGRTLRAVPQDMWSLLEIAGRRIAPGTAGSTSLRYKADKAASAFLDASLTGIYRNMVSHWHDPASVVIGASEPATQFAGASSIRHLDARQQLMLLDAQTYLSDDVLVKVDRAAMGASLETRAPLLDHRVVEFAWRLPQALKVRDHQNKWAIRQVLYRHVPRELIDRPKMGFGVPIGDWLRGPLRGWAEALLDGSRLRREGYFVPEAVRRKWEEHVAGKQNWQYHLWDILMFQSWLEQTHPMTSSAPSLSPWIKDTAPVFQEG
jgi:asparagine synthase (glutamine-hydrolysing)